MDIDRWWVWLLKGESRAGLVSALRSLLVSELYPLRKSKSADVCNGQMRAYKSTRYKSFRRGSRSPTVLVFGRFINYPPSPFPGEVVSDHTMKFAPTFWVTGVIQIIRTLMAKTGHALLPSSGKGEFFALNEWTRIVRINVGNRETFREQRPPVQ